MARYLIYVQQSRFRTMIKINHFSLLISVFTNKSGVAEGASRLVLCLELLGEANWRLKAEPFYVSTQVVNIHLLTAQLVRIT